MSLFGCHQNKTKENGNEEIPMAPHEAERYKLRSACTATRIESQRLEKT